MVLLRRPTFVMYVAGMADDEVRAFGSVAPLKVGLLNDYPTKTDTDSDTVLALRLVFDEAIAAGLVDRQIDLVQRHVVGLPNGTYQGVNRAYDDLVDGGCLLILGPWASDTAVRWAATLTRSRRFR